MNDIVKRFFWLSLYAIAMALLEAVVVAYIRELIHLSNNHGDLKPYVGMEVWREAATLLMLVAVGWLTGRGTRDRLAYGMFAFGLWDIWYYIWLRVLIGWPKTLLDWDTLFLMPLPWRGPVLSAVLVASLICAVAILAVCQAERQQYPGVTPFRFSVVLGGAFLALYIFMEGAIHARLLGGINWRSARPETFDWPLFLIAFAMMAVPSFQASWPARRGSLSNDSVR